MGQTIQDVALNNCRKFFGDCLTHVKGEWAGQPLIPQDWVVEKILCPLFDDDDRQYRTVYVEVPRKNAKSTISAGIALYLLLADGEPGAEVYSAAADREQARIVFDMARQMVEASPELSRVCKVMRSAIVGPNGQTYKVLSADAYTKHGLNAHGIIFDELHTQKNRELWDVLTTSTGSRRQPVVFAITTAGVYDKESICWELHDYAVKVRDGIIEDETFLPVLYGAEKEDDWTDPEVWAKANPGLGVTLKPEYLERKCREAQEVPAAQNTFRRLHLNQWTEQETRWLDMTVWDANSGVVSEDGLAGSECYAGLDLASTIDIAALSLVFPVDDGYATIMRYWVPEENIVKRSKRDRVPYDAWKWDKWITATPGNVIDYDYIRSDINALGEKYNIREIAIDRWNSTQLQTQLDGDGFVIFPFGQGFASMAAPTKELQKLLLGRQMNHGGDPVLRWMASNVAVQQDAAGNLKPAKNKSSEKIDGIVALIMGIGRASVSEGPVVSKYETEELLVL